MILDQTPLLKEIEDYLENLANRLIKNEEENSYQLEVYSDKTSIAVVSIKTNDEND